MTEILIGQSYYLRFDSKLWEAMQPYPPLGSLYAASYVRERGHQVAFFDAMLANSEIEWESALDKEKPAYAVIFEDNFNYLSKMCLLRMRQAAFTMIQMAVRQGCTVIVCGADATDHWREYLHQGANYILLGEGELTLGELLYYLTGRTPGSLDSILGIAYKDGESQRTHTARRPELRDLDSMPFPAWDLVNIDKYRKIWQQRHGYFSMNMVTTRGCPFHCNWCAKPIWGQRYNTRSPENVIAEMKLLKERYQPDHIWFADDILGLKPGWLEVFADLVVVSKLQIPFKCLNRADLLLRKGEIEALRRAGCQIVWIGAESGSQKILDAMEKGTKVEQIYAASGELHGAGLQIGFFLQFGYPGETRQDIEATLQMVRDCQPDDIGISVSYPLPGTPFFERVKEQLGEKQNWYESSDLTILYQGPFSTPFYRQLHRVIHQEFRILKRVNGRNRKQLPGMDADNRPHEPFTKQLRSHLRLGVDVLTLPVERWRLDRLAASGHSDLKFIPPELTQEMAASPTPQNPDG